MTSARNCRICVNQVPSNRTPTWSCSSFREEYYHERRQPGETETAEFHEWQEKMQRIQGITEVIVGKHRHGPTGTVRLLFNGLVTKFSNLAEADTLPEPY